MKLFTTWILGMTSLSAIVLGCVREIGGEGEQDYGLFTLQESQGQAIAQITSFQTAKDYAAANGYWKDSLCQTYLKGGEKVWFSGSYGDGENGQSAGYLVKKLINGRDTFWYVNEQTTTSQGMFPPGLGQMTGESRWEMSRYQQILAQTAFGTGSVNGSIYDSIKGEIISNLTGGTAGGSVEYGDALQLTLFRRASGTTTVIIFVKNQGPRIMEYRETKGPVGGTAKVYIGSSVGS